MNEIQTLKENQIIESSKHLINQNIYKFLFYLFKYIFLNENKTKSSYNAKKKLQLSIKIINENIIKLSVNFISTNYTKQNFKNIIQFVKSQNALYAADIIENIMIIIFSLGFKTDKENTFAKYIYNNLFRIKNPQNIDLANWFESSKFKPEELKDFKKLLIEGPLIENVDKNNHMTELQQKNIFFYVLIELYNEKKKFYENKFKNIMAFYGKIKQVKKEEKIEETYYITDKIQKMEEKSSYSSIDMDEYHEGKLDKSKTITINITRSFFISVYIYYQNRNSPLMKYINQTQSYDINETKDLVNIPFVYDFSSGVIREEFASIIMSSARIEPRINKIDMSKNILKDKGMAELSKILIFNKYIKIIDFHKGAIKSYHLDYLSHGFGIFENYSVEELNISCNYIRDDSFDILGKILSHLKRLKTINLSMNNLGNGIISFLIILKNLYRHKKVMMENLYLNGCMLDYSSFYELGKLLRCKYCKLKNLYLNKNQIPFNINFFKYLKSNKSLSEIYFNNCNIGNGQIDDISRTISNTNLECLYLYNNKIDNFNNCLRIIYRTKLINKKVENNKAKNRISRIDSLLYNLDISDNNFLLKNVNHVILLKKIIEETTLYCLDFAHILFGDNPKDYNGKNKGLEYKKEVDDLKNKLNDKQKKYLEIIEEINTNEIKAEKLKNYNNIILNEKIQKEIEEILKDKNSKFPVFLREKAKNLRKENIQFFEGEDKEEIKDKIVKYMEGQLSKKIIEKLKKEKEEKKLIII